MTKPEMHGKYIGGIACTLRDSAKNTLHSDGTRELLADAAETIAALENARLAMQEHIAWLEAVLRPFAKGQFVSDIDLERARFVLGEPAPEGAMATVYAAPEGSDDNDGLSPDRPVTAAKAWRMAQEAGGGIISCAPGELT